MHRSSIARGIGLALLIAAPARAQLGDYNALPGPHGVYAIRNVKIYPVSGPVIEKGNVVIGADGKIQAVGATAAIPNGAKTLDGTGLTVYPGMMESVSTLGLNEIPGGVVQMNDASEIGSFNPNVHAYFGLNSHSAHIGVTRVVGVTNIISRPNGGIISGQAMLVNLAGDTPAQMSLVRDIAMVINLPGGSGGGRGGGRGLPVQQAAPVPGHTPMDSLRAMLRDAEAYGNAHDAYAKDKTLPRPSRDVVLEAPAENDRLEMILLGGRQALQAADFLKQHNVPVIITGVLSLPPGEDDPYDLNYSLPGKLAAAGVRFAISSGAEQGSERDLPYVAGMAAAFGLSKEDAVRAVTLWPAQIFGVADKIGSIEVGKLANLVMTTGDLLEARTDTKALFINGQPVPLSSKHTYMFELFKDRP